MFGKGAFKRVDVSNSFLSQVFIHSLKCKQLQIELTKALFKPNFQVRDRMDNIRDSLVMLHKQLSPESTQTFPVKVDFC